MNHRALRQLSNTQIRALVMTADAVKTEVMNAAVVPKQTGELERSGHIDDSLVQKGRVKLVYDTPYARRLYWHPEYSFRQDKNANARGRWLDDWITGSNSTFAKKAFQELYRRLNRGTIQ
ncbi:minor capsid protein [Paenibacillus sp. VMFN-D1]|uniref:minor capsid protein n=1 Tax=Paenibacillus sp. VMFN-D1 TaxID=2135608 RepID=UPI002161243A|nr:minor capsid protein [Paenibacillus sp. VMFN-D1]